MVVVAGEGVQPRVGPPHWGPLPGSGAGWYIPAESAAGGEATPPITGGWDHGGSGWSGATYGCPPEIIKRGSAPDPILRALRVNGLVW